MCLVCAGQPGGGWVTFSAESSLCVSPGLWSALGLMGLGTVGLAGHSHGRRGVWKMVGWRTAG